MIFSNLFFYNLFKNLIFNKIYVIRPDSYPQSESPSADHQFGSYKDETAVGANDGTGLFKDQVMDLFQPWANLFTKHSITPSNVKEKASVSQVTEALDAELTLTAGNVDTLDTNGTYTVDFDNKNGVLLLESPLTAVTISPGASVNEGNRLLVQNNTGGSVTVTAGVAIVLADGERLALFYDVHLAAYVTTLGNNVIFGTFKNLSTIDSTSKSTGSQTTKGGMSAEKKIHAGDTIKCDSATDATTKDSAAIVAVNGGIAAEKSIHAGGTIKNDDTTESTTKDTGAIITEGGAGIKKNLVTGGGIGRGSTTILKEKIIDIGDWDMNYSVAGSQTVAVNHGLTQSKIRVVKATIKNDADSQQLDIFSSNNGALSYGTAAILINATNIVLSQDQASSLFDTTSYDSTSYNRGWVYILYEI